MLYLALHGKNAAELADWAKRKAKAFAILFGNEVRIELATGDRVGGDTVGTTAEAIVELRMTTHDCVIINIFWTRTESNSDAENHDFR